MFADTAIITIRSGNGGDGHVGFRRELFVAAGGPNGGDGGRGGDLIFEVDDGLNTLNDFRYIKKYAAGNGENGGNNCCHGADGADLVVKVPEGTVIKDADSGKVIADMSHENRRQVILHGGRGGKGNMHYATATMQVPKYAQPGKKGRELRVLLELKVIADVGLVGYPNVGKSTFLTRVSNARPKVANYHFTTLHPNLGVVNLEGTNGFVIADIPGLIEGASEGVGLGHQFLKHVERCRVILHIVDGASTEGRDPAEDVLTINRELAKYSEVLASKPQIIAVNKMDLFTEEEQEIALSLLRDGLAEEMPDAILMPISAATGKGVREVLYAVYNMLQESKEEPISFEQEFFPETADDDFEDPFEVYFDEEAKVYVVEGPRIERMLGYTNLDSEKGFEFFQNFLKTNGILDQLETLGIKDGDTVRMYGLQFDYYK